MQITLIFMLAVIFIYESPLRKRFDMKGILPDFSRRRVTMV